MARSRRLFAVLTSYLKNRPLRIVRSVDTGDGYQACQSLCREFQPSSRQRSVALAQAILNFPLFERGRTLDGLLAFEKLVEDYEKVSSSKFDGEVKLGCLLRCVPGGLKHHLQLSLTSSTTYAQIRHAIVSYEQTTAAWTTNRIMSQFGPQGPQQDLQNDVGAGIHATPQGLVT